MKPSIFFSHSSKDSKLLIALKEAIIGKTGESFEIFLSSDGQSIPLGRNWVYEIQEALDSTTVVFVFVSPNSIGSSWVYFESGFAYSKKIRVIPVGINGVTVDAISPPLGLLNGFEIKNEDGLNKIVGTINDVLKQNHKFRFSKSAYKKLFDLKRSSTSPESDGVIRSIGFDSVFDVAIPEDYQFLDRSGADPWTRERGPEFILDKAESLSISKGWEYSRQYGVFQLSGISIRAIQENSNTRIVFSATGGAIRTKSDQIDELFRKVIGVPYSEVSLDVRLHRLFDFEVDLDIVSLTLEGTGISLNPAGGLLFEDYIVRFKNRSLSNWESLSTDACISVRSREDKLDLSRIEALVHLLYSKSVIVTRPVPISNDT